MVKNILSRGEQLLHKQSSSILSAALVITGASLLSAVLGLVRNRMLVARFFATTELRAALDAYWVAFRIPELVFQLLVVGALSAAFIPIYSKYKEKNLDEANRMAASMMNIVLIIFFVLSVVVFIFAEDFNSMITSSGFSASQIQLAANLTRVMLLSQLAFAASNFMTGIIQAHHRFLLPALSPLVYNLGIMMGIYFLTPYFSIYGAAIGVVIGAFLHLMIQLPLAMRLGFRPNLSLALNHPGVKEMGKMMLPRAMAISVDQLELMTSVYFATTLPSGNLTVLNLATQLMNAPLRVLSVPIGQASLPFLAKEASMGDMASFRQTLTRTINQVLFLAIPASILLLILRVPLVRLAYGSSNFPWAATLLTGRVVAIMTLAIFAYAGLHILVRAYYALHDTKIPFFVAFGSVIVSALLMAGSTRLTQLGVIGIGLSLTMANIAETGVLAYIMVKKYHAIDGMILFYSMWRVIIASLLTGLALWIPLRLLDTLVFDTTRTIALLGLTLVVSIIGGSVYYLLALWLQIPELNQYKHMFEKFSKWRSVLSSSNEVIEPS